MVVDQDGTPGFSDASDTESERLTVGQGIENKRLDLIAYKWGVVEDFKPPPKEEPPSLRQFWHWYKKHADNRRNE